METKELINTKNAWLGEFPAHWAVLRIKNLFQEMDSRSETGSEELLSVSHYTGVTLKRESLENEDDNLTNAESLVGYKLVQQGDLVINIMLAWNGSLGISPYNGITSPAYCVYRIKGDNNPEYFGYLFSTNLFKAEFRRHSTGIIDSRLRLYSDKFFSIFTVVPPKDEQDEIVQYIKAQEEKIKLFIQKKQRFIELLKEQKSSVINSLMVNGIDKDVEFITTNLPYFEKIPKHWEIRKLSTLTSILTCGLASTPIYVDDEDGVPFLSAQNVKPGRIVLDKFNYISREHHLQLTKNRKPEKGDLLVTRVGAGIGEAAIVDVDFEFSVYVSLTHIRTTHELNNEYLMYFFETAYAKFKNQEGTPLGGGQGNLNVKNLEKYRFPLPPIEEQKQIVSHIKTETATIDTAIAKAEREIELIREYKEAMIAEAVMGKRKL